MTTELDPIAVPITADTRDFQAALRALGGEADRFSSAIGRAFRDAVAGGRSFESVLSSLALRLAGLALDRALQPIANGIGSAIGSLFGAFGLADGGVVAGGTVRRFANGGVVSSPTFFPLARGLGLMGEAGPEAVVPLARGSDGTLGIRGGASAPVVVNLTVNAADADSFRKSEAQLTAMLARAVGRGRRGL